MEKGGGDKSAKVKCRENWKQTTMKGYRAKHFIDTT